MSGRAIDTVFWFRRDLRLDDNHALFQALSAGQSVLAVFIFDDAILKQLPARDGRVEFIHQQIVRLDNELRTVGSALLVLQGSVLKSWQSIFAQHKILYIYCNEDYEPSAIDRDQEIQKLAASKGVGFHTFKDQLIFAKSEIVKDNGEPYRVYTPYARRWRQMLSEASVKAFPSGKILQKFAAVSTADRTTRRLPTLSELGFEPSGLTFPPIAISSDKLKNYDSLRDLLAESGTSHLGLHLRFGTISVRKLVQRARQLSDTYLGELIWREFMSQLLFHNPHTVNAPYDPRHSQIQWRKNPEDFAKWCAGETGFALVDAGMRELNRTGFMHNRARMVTASFLCKDLLLDWKLGERYFAEKLLDYDLASNVGNWQWVAGCGCDAAPYFRVFNPILQAKKFDPQRKYVRRWVAELESADYLPMLDHEMARRRALIAYKAGLNK